MSDEMPPSAPKKSGIPSASWDDAALCLEEAADLFDLEERPFKPYKPVAYPRGTASEALANSVAVIGQRFWAAMAKERREKK